MKITRFLLALLIVVPFISSCTQADIEDLADPRDVIVKEWRVTDNHPSNVNAYDAKISKDAKEPTQIIISGIHGLGLGISVVAKFAYPTITIDSQEVPGGYTIAGSGKVSPDYVNIVFNTTETTLDGTINVRSEFGPVVVTKKKKAQAKKELQ
jgi:hypothetical protein